MVLKQPIIPIIRAYSKRRHCSVTLNYNTLEEAKQRNPGLSGFEFVSSLYYWI